jgi:hypothetical protein
MKSRWPLIALTAGSLFLGRAAGADPKQNPNVAPAARAAEEAHQKEEARKPSRHDSGSIFHTIRRGDNPPVRHTATVKPRHSRRSRHDSGSILRGVRAADASPQGRTAAAERRQEDIRQRDKARQQEAQRRRDEARKKAADRK